MHIQHYEQFMDKQYSVGLLGAEGLPPAERIAAEVRFIKELERSLASEDEVVKVYRAWREASECEASELSADTSSLAVRWPKAFDKAQRNGLKNIGESDAHFELQLELQPIDA
jgi:hypothetical protein